MNKPKDPRRYAAYMQRQALYKRRRRAHLKSINQGAYMPQRWTQFDPAYKAALLSFKEHGTFKLPPCSLKSARSARTKFYVFRKAVYDGLASETDYDPILLDLIDAFTNVMVSIEPTAGGLYVLELCRDPWSTVTPPVSTEHLTDLIEEP
jgi:hypothetical protein